MIEQLLGPIIKPIKRKIIAPLKRAKTLPKRMFAALRKWLVTAIFGPLRSLSNYLRIGSYYIAKKLIALVLVITLIIVYFGFISPPAFINKWFGRTPQLEASAAAEGSFTGAASIVDAAGNLLFEGQLENGQYTGAGKLYYPNGKVRYQGDFAKGMMAGSGELFNEECCSLLYRGEFADNQYAGAGTLFYPDGKPKYEGQFLAGAYEGAGTEYNPDGSIVYAGAFMKGAYSGDGKLYSGPDKLQYEGQFNNGVYEGTGKQYDSDGMLLYEGTYLAGKLSGPGKQYFPSGFVKYDGAFLLGRYHGTGSLFNEAGSVVYTGSFAGGQQNGYGQVFNAGGGVVYDGKFVNGKYEGLGTLFDVDGAQLYKGFFRGGSLYAEGFMNLSLVKLQETLGAPDAPVPASEEEAAAEDGTDGGSQLPDETSTESAAAQPETAALAESDGAAVTAQVSSLQDQTAKEVQILSDTGGTTEDDPEAGGNAEGGVSDAGGNSDGSATGADTEADADGITDSTLPEDALNPAMRQTLTFSAMQMSFLLEADADNPEAFIVRSLTTWNSTVMEQTYSRLLAAKTVSVKEKLENGRTSAIFKSGSSLLTFLLNKDKPVRLEISYILPEE